MTLPGGGPPPGGPPSLFSTVLSVSSKNSQRMIPNSPPGSLANLDQVNTVWVGGTTSTGPGNGTPLLPQGTCDWEGGDLYICLDSASVLPTQCLVNFSTQVKGLLNLVALAEALALIGIPNTLLQTPVLNVQNASAPTTSPMLDVHTFGSIQITAQGIRVDIPPVFPLPSQQWNTLISWYDVGQHLLFQQGFGSPSGDQASIDLPVLGYYMTISYGVLIPTAPSVASMGVSIVGSNRTIDRPTLGTFLTPRNFTAQASVGKPFVSGTDVILSESDIGPGHILANGPASLLLNAGVNGIFFLYYMQPSGLLVVQSFLLHQYVTTEGFLQIFQVNLPSGPFVPVFRPGAASTTASVVFELMANG